jgi:isoaspartyl peptidase/L-asparaginase-like protein (Ntn-hydrolase superfamily)
MTMAEKSWGEMGGWQKAWEVTKVVGGLALLALLIAAAVSGGGTGPSLGGRVGGRSVWTVGHGGKKGYGSWSSFRHG